MTAKKQLAPITQEQYESYSSLPFNKRFATLGGEAEGKFEKYCQHNDYRFERFGFNRPSFKKFWNMPIQLRTAPDYVLEIKNQYYFVECKGTGKSIKIKQETLDQIPFWEGILPVRYFVYNSVENGYAFLTQEQLLSTVLEHGTKKHFEGDNKEYYELPRNAIQFTKEF